MTRIDFYLLKAGAAEDFAVRLCDKALRQNKRVYVFAASDAQAAKLDQRLWSDDPGSFIPHDLATDANPATPLVIGTQPPAHDYDVLVQLAADVPLCFSNFDRVAEIVAPDDAAKNAGRARYAFYKDRGYELHHHQL